MKPVLKGYCTLNELKTSISIDELQELHFAMDEVEKAERDAQNDS